VNLTTALTLTFFLCFIVTLARVIAQPIAASSVFILICYVVAYGGANHTLAAGTAGMISYLAGGLWSASLAFLLWPLDPFLPARNAVAGIYAALQRLSAALPHLQEPDGPTRFNDQLAHTRTSLEAAHAALAATPARMTARTIRARNLSVLVESADLILARILRFAELGHDSPTALATIDIWLQSSLAPLERALHERPHDLARAFHPEGSLSLDLHRNEPLAETALNDDITLTPDTRTYLTAALRDTLFNLEVSFEALRAVWTGAESRQREATTFRAQLTGTRATVSSDWLESLRANLTLRSVMFRYAIRLATVVTVDILLLRLIHIGHSYWLPMTSLIVLRPYAGETVKRSADRVLGTVLGGILAALLTAVLPGEISLLCVIVIGATIAIALYAVDYAWYCFFLTPTIVLLTLPHLRDWHLAFIRAGFTGLGALIAVLAMLLLWPERESLQLPSLLARAAAADAAYLRALLTYWHQIGCPTHDGTIVLGGMQDSAIGKRLQAERTLLAPARRRCGLAVNDAEDTLDHALLENTIPLNPRRHHTQRLNSAALTFTTYLRRITRTTTTLAAVGPGNDSLTPSIQTLATRLEAISQTLLHKPTDNSTTDPITLPPQPLLAEQLRRLDRQISILESTTTELAAL
jgi:uncharacterized membrane protein YccC